MEIALRKSRKSKKVFQQFYKSCLLNGHDFKEIDKNSRVLRCKACDYCPKQDGKKRVAKSL